MRSRRSRGAATSCRRSPRASAPFHPRRVRWACAKTREPPLSQRGRSPNSVRSPFEPPTGRLPRSSGLLRSGSLDSRRGLALRLRGRLWLRRGGRLYGGLRAALARRRRVASYRRDALAKRVHDADDVAWPRGLLRRLCWHPGLLRPDELDHRILITVSEFLRAEVPGLPLNDDVGQILHFLRQFHLGNLFEVGIFVTHLRAITKYGAQETFSQGLQHHDAFAPRHHDPAQSDDLLVAHGVSNDREGLLRDALARRNVVGRFKIARIDLRAGHKFFNVDGVRALDLDLVKLLVVDQQVGILGDR